MGEWELNGTHETKSQSSSSCSSVCSTSELLTLLLLDYAATEAHHNGAHQQKHAEEPPPEPEQEPVQEVMEADTRRNVNRDTASDVLGWEAMDGDELKSLSFLRLPGQEAREHVGVLGGKGDESVTAREEEIGAGLFGLPVPKIRWADSMDGCKLANVHEYSNATVNLKRRVRSSAQKQAEKEAKRKKKGIFSGRKDRMYDNDADGGISNAA